MIIGIILNFPHQNPVNKRVFRDSGTSKKNNHPLLPPSPSAISCIAVFYIITFTKLSQQGIRGNEPLGVKGRVSRKIPPRTALESLLSRFPPEMKLPFGTGANKAWMPR